MVSAFSTLRVSSPGKSSAKANTLNLGCGRKYLDDAINLDITPLTRPDVLHDLNEMPWPFEDGQFDEVLAHDVLEHLDNVIMAMEEIHRICRHGASVRITVPHFSCANTFTDPTHKHAFGWNSFDFVTGVSENSFYSRAEFRYSTRRMIFHPTLANRVIMRLANRRPERYERRWAWIFPAWFLYFELEVVKEIN